MNKAVRKAVIAGNWKMNKTPAEAKELITAIAPLVKDAGCDVVACVPYVDIATAIEAAKGTNIKIGAENCHWAVSGAFTGEISAEMLKACGVEYVITGHSERRTYFGDTDVTVQKRTRAALDAGLTVIVCVGEYLEQREQGITEVYGREKQRWFVKAPAFSFSKIRGVESYLSPEMKSTGEAIGYDDKLTRALYKALQASGMKVANYGTVLLTIADKDKEEVLPLARRFYNLGFNIEATSGTADFLRRHGLRTRLRRKLCEGSSEIIDSLRQGHVSYIINTIDLDQHNTRFDGYEIRRTAVENNVTLFTSLETVKVLLDVLEEITLSVSTIDAK